MDSSTVLVVGATGKQGRALLSALMANPNPPPVLALTRNVASASAQGLKKQYEGSKFDLVQGDSSKPAAIFASQPKGSVGSLFMYTNPPMSKKDPSETSQAIPLIDAAVAHGVQHIVFSSVERGGNEESWDNPCEHIEHFHQKHLIELHLRDKAVKEGSFSWTILRPVAFMDNLQPGLFGSLFASMWNSMLSPETKLQLVATSDIGVWAADAVVEPSSTRFRNQAIALAGDELSLREVKDVFRKCVGKDLPQSMGLLGKALMWWLTEVGNMLRWFETNGFGADIGTLRKQHSMLTLDDWLRQESQWKDRSAS